MSRNFLTLESAAKNRPRWSTTTTDIWVHCLPCRATYGASCGEAQQNCLLDGLVAIRTRWAFRPV